MLRYCKSSCTSAHTWCYATVRLLALPHIHDATLLHVFLHFLTYMMLRYFTSSCTSSHTWCYAAVSLLALPHIHDATPLYVFLPCLTYIHALLNGKIWTHARAWQWRWENSSHKNLSKLTAEVVKNTLRRKKRKPLRFLTCPVKNTRALFKEIQLWERCKTTVIYGMKWMMNSANVGNAGSINHPQGCFSWHCKHVCCWD